MSTQDTQVTTQDNLLAMLAEAIDARSAQKDWDKEAGATEIARHDEKHIALPRHMPLRAAAEITSAMAKQDEQLVDFRYTVVGFPLDAALMLHSVLREMYGYVKAVNQPGMWGPSRPKTIAVEVAAGEKKRIPWGRLQLHYFSDQEYLDMGFTLTPEGLPAFEIYGVVKRVNENAMMHIMKLVDERLKTESIYRGKAIVLTDLSWRTNPRYFNPDKSPGFFQTGVSLDDVIMPAAQRAVLNAEIMMRIRETEKCREMGIKVGCGALFTGPYGTGKTLTASAIASECEANDWSFMYLKEPKDGDIEYAIELAGIYARADKGTVLFVEDVDLMTSQERNRGSNALINAMDNVTSKAGQVIVIFTTNSPLNIDPALRRAGRIDLFLPFTRPTGQEALQFIYMYAGGELAEDADTEELVGALSELSMTPAFLNQVVTRARLIALAENRAGTITPEDVLHSLTISREHIDYAEERVEEPEVTVDSLLAKMVKDRVDAASDHAVDVIIDHINDHF